MKLMTRICSCCFLLVFTQHNLSAESHYKFWNENSVSRIIKLMSEEIRERYVFPDVGEQMANVLAMKVQRGDFKDMRPDQLAESVTKVMRDISKDKHMVTIAKYTDEYDRQSSEQETKDQQSVEVKTLPNIEEATLLEGNIGYFKLNAFMEPEKSFPEIKAAMLLISQSDALIIDLRNNSGGSPQAVRYLSTYFFKDKTLLNTQYWRKDNYISELWTVDDFHEAKYLNKPVVVLISKQTKSAAESFAYILKHNKVATLIGERTSGGAHFADVYDIEDKFLLQIAIGRVVNPVTKSNWEGTGVTPHKETGKEEALSEALRFLSN